MIISIIHRQNTDFVAVSQVEDNVKCSGHYILRMYKFGC